MTPWRIPLTDIDDPDLLENETPPHNPAVRAFTLAEDLTPSDYTQYYMDLDAANEAGQATWVEHYSFKVCIYEYIAQYGKHASHWNLSFSVLQSHLICCLQTSFCY